MFACRSPACHVGVPKYKVLTLFQKYRRLNAFLDHVHIFVYFIFMKRISFYKTETGRCPVEEHLDTLTDTQVAKITWVLKLIREMDNISTEFFKKLVNTDDIWEVRVSAGKNIFRLLGFIHEQEIIILTNSFQKKTRKTPKKEIKLAEKRKKDYLSRREHHG